MAQFLIITEDSLSLQRSPIIHINSRRLSKRNYITLLRTLSKFLFYRRLHFHNDKINSDFIFALRAEAVIESHLNYSSLFPLSVLSFMVYSDLVATVFDFTLSDKRPILFNLDSYEFSFYDPNYYDNRIYDGLDLPYTSL